MEVNSMNIQDVKQMIKSYKAIQCKVRNLKLELEETSIKSVNYNAIHISNSNISTLDNELLRKEHIEREIKSYEIQLKKIENLLEVLTDKQRKVIELRYIKEWSYDAITNVLYREYTSIKAIEKKAFNRLLQAI